MKTKEAIRIGAIFPLSGPYGSLGSENLLGAQIAQEMINEQGGVQGMHVEFEIHDSPTPSEAEKAVEYLARHSGVVLMIGTLASPLSIAASAVAERYKVVYWEVCAAADTITTRGLRYIFNCSISTSLLGEIAIEFLNTIILPRLGHSKNDLKIAIVHVDSIFGVSMAQTYLKGLDALDVKNYEIYKYLPESRYIDHVVEELRSYKPNIILLSQYTDDSIWFWKGLKAANVDISAVIGTGGGQTFGFARAVGDTADGIFFADAPYTAFMNPQSLPLRVQEVQKNYHKRYMSLTGGQPTVDADQGFVSTFLLLNNVLPKADCSEADSIRESALAVDLPIGSLINGFGCLFEGPESEIAGRNIRAFAVIHQWQNGWPMLVFPKQYAASHPGMIPLPTTYPKPKFNEGGEN